MLQEWEQKMNLGRMECIPDTCPLSSFKPVCNKAHGQLDPSSPHARNAALMPFLFFIHPSTSGHLHVLVSDFHFNTWHASFTCEYLNGLKEILGIKESFQSYLQGLHDGFSSSKVKVELGGPASAVGGEGASSAKLKTTINVIGTSREVCLDLELSEGRCANDTKGTLAWELFESLLAAKAEISQLERAVREEKEKCAKVLDAVVQGKPTAVHFFSNKIPLWPSQGREICSPSTPVDSLCKFSRSTIAWNSGKVNNSRPSCSSSLKLAEPNRYGRTAKLAEKKEEPSVSTGLGDGQISDISMSCTSGNSEMMTPFSEDHKCLDASPDINDKMTTGVMERSTDTWARRHYMEWRKEQGLPEKQIEELPLPDFADSLVKFFLMVKKHNGNLFPSESLKSMFRAFVRILRSHYKRLYIQGKYDGPIVDASQDMLFERARLACMEAMKHSILHGGNKKRKVEERQPASEEEILRHPANQTTHAHGLARRLCYYSIHKFHIYGYMELYDTTDLEFRRGADEKGNPFWEYDEKRAAKYKYKETFRDVVRCFDIDVVECMDKYFMHLPSKTLEDEPRRLFLAPISKPRSNVWFCHQNISSKTLRAWYRYMGPVSNTPVMQNKSHCLTQPRNITRSYTADIDGMTTEGQQAMHLIDDSTKIELDMGKEPETPLSFAHGGHVQSDMDEGNDDIDTENDDEITDNELTDSVNVNINAHAQMDDSEADMKDLTV